MEFIQLHFNSRVYGMAFEDVYCSPYWYFWEVHISNKPIAGGLCFILHNLSSKPFRILTYSCFWSKQLVAEWVNALTGSQRLIINPQKPLCISMFATYIKLRWKTPLWWSPGGLTRILILQLWFYNYLKSHKLLLGVRLKISSTPSWYTWRSAILSRAN